MPEGEGGELKRHAVLIRHFFHVDPWSLDEGDFAQLAADAKFLENRQEKFNQLAQLQALSRVFGIKK